MTDNKTPKQTTHTCAIPGRHVKVTITNTSVTRKVRMMDREMPVVAISQVDVQGGLIYTDAYRIDYEDKTIAGIPSGTFVKQFSAQLQPVEGATIRVYRPNEDAEVTSGTIEPSMSVVVTANNGLQREYYTLDIEP